MDFAHSRNGLACEGRSCLVRFGLVKNLLKVIRRDCDYGSLVFQKSLWNSADAVSGSSSFEKFTKGGSHVDKSDKYAPQMLHPDDIIIRLDDPEFKCCRKVFIEGTC